jgi:rRNA maturation endonuclease Nob1
MKLFFDSMVWDLVDANGEFEANLRRVKDAGAIQVLRSHIQIDQNSRMKDKSKLARIQKLRERFEETPIPTSLFILGSSRLGEAKLGSPSATERYLQMVDEADTKTGDKMDAVLAVTAHESEAVFVTDDVNLQKKCQKLGILFWSPNELLERLKTLN